MAAVGTAIAGIDGSITFASGTNIRAASHGVEIFQEINDCSGFTVQPWRENLSGMKSGRGSCAGYLEYNASSTSPGLPTSTAGTVTFTFFTGCTLAGSFRKSRQSYGTGIDGNAIGAVDFTLTGTATLTWDETP
jgi:hypothetical protein